MNAWFNRFRRPVTIVTPVVAVMMLAITGCSSQRVQTSEQTVAQQEIINPERSKLGNPAVYEVFGERYYVMESSAGYRERGTASWYGEKFHGRSTSGGEPYDMYAMTAAHKSLPIPTWVEVTNLSNGERIIVKVNDRGPFVDDRIIDLSYAAAEALDMVQAGTARVEVRALGEPASSPATTQAATRPPAEPSPGGFSIISEAAAAIPDEGDRPMQRIYAQVGAFSEADNAERLVGTLKAGGYDSVFVLSEAQTSGAMHRVRIGPLEGIDEYDELVVELSRIGLSESRLIVER